MRPSAYFEISPLFEAHWTGIPAVTAALARQAIDDSTIDWNFFFNTLALPSNFVRSLLTAGGGLKAKDFLLSHCWGKNDILFDEASTKKAIFLNMKACHRFFREEAIVVYDLSPLLTPQFHAQTTIDHYASRFRSDIESSDNFFCISEATRDDLIAYFRVPVEKTRVLQMGVGIDITAISAAQNSASINSIEPYVVVLGTLEPRKNGKLILEYLSEDPGFANRFRVVFVGRDGWLDERNRLLGVIERAGIRSDRIVFTGYVSEFEKIALLYNSAFCIYPSFFEGYGLPILEAATLGKLVVCSNTSSMPEVAPNNCIFFNPLSMPQFIEAISLAEKRAPQLRSPTSLIDFEERLKARSWEASYSCIADWVKA